MRQARTLNFEDVECRVVLSGITVGGDAAAEPPESVVVERSLSDLDSGTVQDESDEDSSAGGNRRRTFWAYAYTSYNQSSSTP